jgi:hypothetical protein
MDGAENIATAKNVSIAYGIPLDEQEIASYKQQILNDSIGLALDGIPAAQVVGKARALMSGRGLAMVAQASRAAGRGVVGYGSNQLKSGFMRTLLAPERGAANGVLDEAANFAAHPVSGLLARAPILRNFRFFTSPRWRVLDKLLNPGQTVAELAGKGASRTLAGRVATWGPNYVGVIPKLKASLPLVVGTSVVVDPLIYAAYGKAYKGVKSLFSPSDKQGSAYAFSHEFDVRYGDIVKDLHDGKIDEAEAQKRINERHTLFKDYLDGMGTLFDSTQQGPESQAALENWMNSKLGDEKERKKFVEFFKPVVLMNKGEYRDAGALDFDETRPEVMPTHVVYGLMMANYHKLVTQEAIDGWFVEKGSGSSTQRQIKRDDFYNKYIVGNGGSFAQTLVQAWEAGKIPLPELKLALMVQAENRMQFEMLGLMPDHPKLKDPEHPGEYLDFERYMIGVRMELEQKYGVKFN